ncbi:MAG: hypothetical protein JOZ57_15765, partial [Abitibacteriaceae bacterium]|nr:hypothetical protein [Abditibacteriaceae bacterium]
DEQYIFKGYAAGAVDYLFKPFDPQILRAKVTVFVDLYKQSEQIRRQAQQLHESGKREKERELTELQLQVERRLLAEVTALNGHLELRVRERTAQLEQANRDLEAANQELEAFSYSVSHDLRTPLRVIDGFTNILVKDYGPQLTEEALQYLHMVRDNAQQMNHLIDDLLAFSRLSRQPLKKRPVDLAALVQEVMTDLQAAEPAHPIETHIGELPVCQGDPALLKQVFVNLLSNALKYSRKRGKTIIEVGWCEGNETGEPIYYVKDNGVGFDMKYAPNLFGVFQRLHRAEEYEGTGVGLAIVQRIIQRHGGRVWADAELGKGATFFLTLPPAPPELVLHQA